MSRRRRAVTGCGARSTSEPRRMRSVNCQRQHGTLSKTYRTMCRTMCRTIYRTTRDAGATRGDYAHHRARAPYSVAIRVIEHAGARNVRIHAVPGVVRPEAGRRLPVVQLLVRHEYVH